MIFDDKISLQICENKNKDYKIKSKNLGLEKFPTFSLLMKGNFHKGLFFDKFFYKKF